MEVHATIDQARKKLGNEAIVKPQMDTQIPWHNPLDWFGWDEFDMKFKMVIFMIWTKDQWTVILQYSNA